MKKDELSKLIMETAAEKVKSEYPDNLGEQNFGAMGLGEFAAKKCGVESVEVNGKTYHCDKISFLLTQFSWAWTGYYWYDKQTGQMVPERRKERQFRGD